jgi:hypothetical protein
VKLSWSACAVTASRKFARLVGPGVCLQMSPRRVGAGVFLSGEVSRCAVRNARATTQSIRDFGRLRLAAGAATARNDAATTAGNQDPATVPARARSGSTERTGRQSECSNQKITGSLDFAVVAEAALRLHRATKLLNGVLIAVRGPKAVFSLGPY